MSDHRDYYRGRKVLVTGGLGFIGSNLCRTLADLGAQVTAVDSLLPDYGGNLFNLDGYEDKVRINIADVRGHGMEYLVRGQEVLFNLAGQVSHIDSMSDPVTDLEINCTSQLRLLEAVRRGNPELKIVYAGTRQVYGRPLYLPVDEKHLLQPVDVNGINKISGEFYHLVYHQVYGIRASSLRLTNTYGPRQLIRHNRQGFIGWFVRQAALGEEIQIFGDGQQKRDFNHVDDVVDAFLRAGAIDAADGQVINLGDAHPVSLAELVRLLLDVAGGGSFVLVPFPPERKRIDIGDFYADISRARDLLGWAPKVRPARGPGADGRVLPPPQGALPVSAPVPFVRLQGTRRGAARRARRGGRARARLRLVHPGPRGRGVRARAGGGARRARRRRGRQRHRRAPAGAARARRRPGRRGRHHARSRPPSRRSPSSRRARGRCSSTSTR